MNPVRVHVAVALGAQATGRAFASNAVKVVARATHNRADQLRDELGFQEANALERLAIARVLHNWLMVGVLEVKARWWKPHAKEHAQVQRCLSQAERRLMQAVEALAFLRRCHPADVAARLPAAVATVRP